MTWFADLSPCTYFPVEERDKLLAIGWLEKNQLFETGQVSQAVYARLCQLLGDPWQPTAMAGLHDCSLCQFNAEAQGCQNLFVPDRRVVFVCPELISHYINAHGYAPPEEFCRAVIACPDTRTMEYKRLLLASGLRLCNSA